jgi:hypothetical protein
LKKLEGVFLTIYEGKWVFLVNLEGIELIYNEELDGMEYTDPTFAEVFITADKAYEGSESGIYSRIRADREKYGITSEMDCRSGNIFPQNYNIPLNNNGTINV